MCRMKVEAVKFEEQAEFLPTVFENRRERKTVVLEFSYLSDSLEQAARENSFYVREPRTTADSLNKEYQEGACCDISCVIDCVALVQFDDVNYVISDVPETQSGGIL
ncbi:uncharacterized protein LOC116851042 isoform X2 [Odontomachus brunneus]|uniref:uncharacterized protein LOC116851042 isoform X2 n=1 Tax=Odontomachus brunneus TaxID=486640 RepID=UPI0013F2803E|nr:uncharacterized protein LOC116851042 isoform X2 [Odontomachus brunneus]